MVKCWFQASALTHFCCLLVRKLFFLTYSRNLRNILSSRDASSLPVISIDEVRGLLMTHLLKRHVEEHILGSIVVGKCDSQCRTFGWKGFILSHQLEHHVFKRTHEVQPPPPAKGRHLPCQVYQHLSGGARNNNKHFKYFLLLHITPQETKTVSGQRVTGTKCLGFVSVSYIIN